MSTMQIDKMSGLTTVLPTILVEKISLTGLAEVNAPKAKNITGTPLTGTGGATEKLVKAPSAPCNIA